MKFFKKTKHRISQIYLTSMFKISSKGYRSGFTLLEILLVVAAIAILAGIVIFAINPGKQLAELRNGKRRADINLIVNALYQYTIDNGGNIQNLYQSRGDEPCPTYTDTEVCTTLGCPTNLDFLLESQKYLVSMPVDPSGGIIGQDYSGYYVYSNGNNRITACAPRAELGVDISVTR